MVWNSIYIPPSIYSSFLLDWDRWLEANLLYNRCSSMNIPWDTWFTFTCSHIWKWRCKCVFDCTFNLPFNMRAIILDYIAEWTAASKHHRKTHATHIVSLHWSKPPAGSMKINVDGSLMSNGCIGAGGIMRDCNGDWCGGFMVNLGTGNILQAEAWGMFYGLQLAVNAGVQLVEIETDSANLNHLLQTVTANYHPLATVIENCKRLSSNFLSCATRHVHREVNSVADILAKDSLSCAKGVIWLNAAPASITKALQDDKAGISTLRRIPAQIPYCFTATDEVTVCSPRPPHVQNTDIEDQNADNEDYVMLHRQERPFDDGNAGFDVHNLPMEGAVPISKPSSYG